MQKTVYFFMKGLKEGTDTVVNFNYMGWPMLNIPTDTSVPVFRIFAFPSSVLMFR